jgi:WD40 repeat protein
MAEERHGGPGDVGVTSTVAATGPSDGRDAAQRDAPGASILAIVPRSSYEVQGEIARGGLGRILEARDHRLERRVAIKELLGQHLDEAGLAARFEREALLTARLQHPAIVPVYEAGQWPDGHPFYTMKLVEGQSLEAAVKARPLLEDRLVLVPHVIDVANALAYAHGKRIIHRDLKPANVLVGAFGETVVIDWGLAKDLAGNAPEPSAGSSGPVAVGATQAGSVLGTPAYMPPEQALGDPVDERADVYALGALLYHVLAGGPPYSGKSSAEILAQVVHEPPVDLLDKEPAAPPELAAITRKALARAPGERYPTAAELAADLGRYQRGQRVLAHTYGMLALIKRFVRRHRAALTVALGMAALLAAIVVRDFRRIVEERDLAEAERLEAQRLHEQADARGDALALREAEAHLAKDPRQALAWLKHLAPDSRVYGAARVIAAEALARGTPQRVLTDTLAGAALASPDGALVALARADDVVLLDVASGQTQTLRGRGGPMRALAFAPDGRRLAWAGADGTIFVFSRGVGATTALAGHAGSVAALAFASDGRLVSAGHDGTLRVWHPGEAQPPELRALQAGPLVDLAVAGNLVAVAGSDGAVRLLSLDAASDAGPAAIFPVHVALNRVALSPSGAWLAAAGDSPQLFVWEVAPRRRVALEPHGAHVTALAFSPGEVLLASGDVDGGLRIDDLAGHRTQALAAHEDALLDLAFVDGETLVTAGRDHAVRVWDPRFGRQVRALLGHEGDVAALAIAGRRVISAGRDRTVRVWGLDAAQARVALRAERPLLALAAEGARVAAGGSGALFLAEGGGPARPLPAHGERVRALAFAPYGGPLAIGLESGAVRLSDAGDTPREFGRVGGAAQTLAFDPRGRLLAAGGPAGLLVFDVTAGPLFSDGAAVAALAFSPGGSLLATAGAEVKLWETDRGHVRLLEGAVGPFTTVAMSTDGHHVAAGGPRGAWVWSISSGALEELGGDAVTRLAFTSDGRLLVAVAGDRMLRVWEVASGQGRTFPVEGAALTELGALRAASAVTAASDGSLRVWDLASGRSRRLGAHTGPVVAITLADGGKSVASAGEDGTVRLWPDELPEEPAALRAVLAGATDAEVGENF